MVCIIPSEESLPALDVSIGSIVSGNQGYHDASLGSSHSRHCIFILSCYTWKVINRSGWYHDMSVGIEA